MELSLTISRGLVPAHTQNFNRLVRGFGRTMFHWNKNKKTNPEYYSYEVKGTACGDAEQVRRKLEKQVTSISPVQIKIKQEKKPEVTETVLKINLHCEGCANDVRRCVRKMAGVQSVEPDMNASTVTIKSTVDPEDLIARIKKKTGKNAENYKAKMLRRSNITFSLVERGEDM
ncbi:Heavy metal-associated domain, HMA [Artemisia annua]|uniref:Heavy metal-associated domain, HMA n=1 Tax=Artemisia annua TaxID=35608 RepID=A0A2U1QJN4_ARTAN|nr:Heavy metal-associated domain, HMA [Artemisia annua]